LLQEQGNSSGWQQSHAAVDVRVVAATNGDLSKLVAEEGFRQRSILFRLDECFPRQVPALRESREDLPLLVALFRARTSAGAE